jgi:hypothetical protein
VNSKAQEEAAMEAELFWEQQVLHDDASCRLMEQMFGAEGIVDEDAATSAAWAKKRALAEVGMAQWTQQQIVEWTTLLGLEPDAEDAVEAVLSKQNAAGLKDLSDRKSLAKELRRQGGATNAPADGGWEGVADAIIKKRDEMLYISEHLDEFSKAGGSADDINKMFDQLVRSMDAKDVSAALWCMGAIPLSKLATVWGLGSKWARRAQVGGRFHEERLRRKEQEEGQMKKLMSTEMADWSHEQVLEWCGLIELSAADTAIVRAAFAAAMFDGKILVSYDRSDELSALLHQHGAQGLSALSLAETVLEKRDAAIGARQKLLSIGFEMDGNLPLLPEDKAGEFKNSFYRAVSNRFGELMVLHGPGLTAQPAAGCWLLSN